MYSISVIVPVYQVERYIARCAQSLFEQTLDNVEYIFIDDCTQDNSICILKDMIQNYPQRVPHIRVVKMPINSGIAAVRKYGMDLSRGEYIIHCDSDDWFDNDALRKLYLTAKREKCDIVFFDYYKTDGNAHVVVNRNLKLHDTDKFIEILRSMSWSLWGGLVRRSIYTDNCIVHPTSNNGEDLVYMLQYLFYSQSYYYLSEPLYYYRNNPTSITNIDSTNGTLKRFNGILTSTKQLIVFFQSQVSPEKYKDVILFLKIWCKEVLVPNISDSRIKELWSATFPEINCISVFCNKNIPLVMRLSFISIKIGTYSLYKLILDFHCKRNNL